MVSTRRLAAIMFTDTVGYTASTQADEGRTLDLLRQQAELIRPLLAVHHGREIKSTGDGFLVEFDSALKATQCAVSIQRRIYERNAEGGLAPIQIRIGIHLGDVVQSGADILGDAVNIAARIEPIAEPGGICLSGAVHEQVRKKIPERLEKLPPKALKGLEAPMDVYRVVLPWAVREPPAPGSGRTRLAVLPFANISPDPKDAYFADGLTEELISSLSKIRNLRVIARTSVGQYKSTTKTVSQIGEELGVTSLLEGSVRKAGNRLRITLQLIDTGTQDHIWADSYDRELDDVFAVQTEIAERTAGALRLELLGPERESIRKEPTTNLTAYTLYLKGIHAFRLASFESLAESIPFFEESIRIDPAFSQAYASLANVLIGLAGDRLAVDEVSTRARELTAKALELDPNSSDAHTACGNLALQFDQEWNTAEAEFQRAISLNPSNALAHFWYANLMMTVGRYDESMKEFRTTIELDPLWRPGFTGLGTVQCLSGDFAAAIATAEENLDRNPGDPAPHIWLGITYVVAGRMADARREAELSAGPVGSWGAWTRAILWAQTGKPEETRRVLIEMEETSRTQYVSPAWIAEMYAALGEREKAFEWLERDGGEGVRSLWFRFQESAFDSIREDSRFKSMLAKLNLPTDQGRMRRREQFNDGSEQNPGRGA
ncbi:MAG: tetratricopeptide repeat protein [Thermoplasmata archaeon]